VRTAASSRLFSPVQSACSSPFDHAEERDGSMISTAPLQSRITISAAHYLTETDPALDRMISLAEHNQFLDAAALAEQLWQQQIYDVRTIGFYLFGVFLEQGLPALPRILSCIQTAITTNWPHLGPGHNLQRHLDGALRWLFINMLSRLRFHQRKQDEQWKLWLKEWEQVPQQQVLLGTMELAAGLTEVLLAPQCCGHLFSLGTMLRTLPTTNLGVAPFLPVLAEAPDAAVASVENVKMQPQDSSAGDAPKSADPASAPGSLTALTVPLSPPMQLLLRKLAAFNQLVKLAKFGQAAIIYKDIKQSLEKFDPRVYLPTLFGEYFSNLVAHAQSLTPNLVPKDDFTSQALQDLYQLDIDLFIAAKS
jgi:hypothetical protein